MTYCKYCGTEFTECTFGNTREERLGCDNSKCPTIKILHKNLEGAKDGYPKSKEDYLPPPPVLYNEETGEKLEG